MAWSSVYGGRCNSNWQSSGHGWCASVIMDSLLAMSDWTQPQTKPAPSYFDDFSKQLERGKPRLPKGKLDRKVNAQTSPSFKEK